jgi:hypothetical protein
MFNIFKRNEKTNDPYEGIGLGDRAKDTITGFEGIVMARLENLTGCNQVFIQPTTVSKDEIKAGVWVDIERVESVAKDAVSIKSRPTGSDIPLPIVTGRR